ncbi:MAG: Gfo/Idh/MocA family oxidoreductase [Pseudomonadota bacterium]
MHIVDTALAQRAASGNPIRVGLIGAGYSARRIAYQIEQSVPGLRVVAIANRTLEHARGAFAFAGVSAPRTVLRQAEAKCAIAVGAQFITDVAELVTASDYIDVVVEATGSVGFGARVTLDAIDNGKHVVAMNVEMDATIGPLLAHRARARGVIYTNSDGDEPGVAMNLLRHVRSLGLTPVVAGNLKGFFDPYRTPDTQRAFAEAHGQKPQTAAHFADGTKLAMELAVLANATGLSVGRRGMFGPSLAHVNDAAEFYARRPTGEGIVDFLVGAAPGNGVFVLARTDDPMRQAYLRYLKQGDGPLYTFYTPFHLPQLDVPNTIARAALFDDAAVSPAGAPVCDAIAVAKKDLAVGDVLDGLGGHCAYGLLEDYALSARDACLPIGLSEGCRVIRPVAKDQLITCADVVIPQGREIDALRTEQNTLFGFATADRPRAMGGLA